MQPLLVSEVKLWLRALLVLFQQPCDVGPVTTPVCSDEDREAEND